MPTLPTPKPPAPKPPAKAKKRRVKAPKIAVDRLSDADVNRAPVAWGRRVARLVGEKFAVQMSLDRSKNEGRRGDVRIAIKCAKSRSAPIFVSAKMLERSDEVWGVFLVVGQGAQIWKCDAEFVRRAAYFNRHPDYPPRAELRFRAIARGGVLLGRLSEREVESCEIP